MVKVALLIGVSEFADAALSSLPAALRDINAVQAVLNHAETGGFDTVRLLENPDRAWMEEAIDALFRDRQKDDLVLLYFSGHGIKDDTGRLFLATRITEKHRLRTTAVAASFVHDVMTSSKSRRQVVILDCCFSGAFATGMMAKDDSSVDVKAQLGGEGRAVLTASTATQYAFAQPDEELSVYTRFLVEGIRTGAADTDNDGHITVDELHNYAQRKVQEAAPAMKPEIYAVKEGYTIQLAKAPLGDPTLEYRKEVEKCVRNSQISIVGRRILQRRRHALNVTEAEASTIEVAVLEPFREYERNLGEFIRALHDALNAENGELSPETCDELKRYQQLLKLRDENIIPVLAQLKVDLSASVQASTASHFQTPTLHTSPATPATDNLRSDKGIDYTKLQNFLKAQQWKEADYETCLVMLQVMGRKDSNEIESEDIEIFSLADLRTINNLWLSYSKQRFGFSTQMRIWEAVSENYEAFGDRVGWRTSDSWLYYAEIIFDISAPRGHLPIPFAGADGLDGFNATYFMMALLSRRGL
jgi:uncharacterized caspase-like protein